MIRILKGLFILLLGLLCGCAPAMAPAGAIKLSTMRQPTVGLEKIMISIKRSVYSRALESSRGPANLRIVPMIVSTAQAPSTPEYRLFNIRKGSVGDVLGLKNSDILIAAHEYVVQNPSQFYQYLIAVQNEKSSSIEIRRGDHPVIIAFDFIEG